MTNPGTTVAVQNPTSAPMTFPQKVAYARELAGSDLLPKQFRNDYASVLWAMEYGEALGLRGVVVISAIHVIEGKPAPSAAMAAGLIRSRGHRLRVHVTPPTAEHRWGTAVAELTRSDDPEFTFRAEWSVEDAVRAEICQIKNGEIYHRTSNNRTGNWQKFPRQMMKARALGEVCRDAATDVLLGLHYLAEELEGAELDRNGNLVSSESVPAVAVVTHEEDARPVTIHAPATDQDVDTVDLEAPISRRTQNEMMGELREAGLGGKTNEAREKRRRVIEIITQQELTPDSVLTEGEGQIVRDALRLADDATAYVNGLLIEDVEPEESPPVDES